MKITVETSLTPDITERFLAVYRAAFAPLEILSAGRQSLTDDEFRADMVEPSVMKYMGWTRRGEPVAMLTVSTDLDHVPWISPPYWRHHYPEHAARNAIWYVGSFLVSPEVKGGPWMWRLASEVATRCATEKVVVGYDCCKYNTDIVKLPQMLADICHGLANVDTDLVDVQNYYAFVFDGLRDGDS